MNINEEDADLALIRRVASGESKAIADFYSSHIDAIYRSVFNQVGRDQQATQDIVQDTFIAAIKSAKNFEGKSSVFTWLYGIAHRKVADYFRKKKLDGKYASHYQDAPQDIFEVLEDPVNLEENAIIKTYLQDILRQMPLHYRQILLLKYIDGMSVAEIASIMNKSNKSVEGILSRAREELKKSLGKIGNPEHI